MGGRSRSAGTILVVLVLLLSGANGAAANAVEGEQVQSSAPRPGSVTPALRTPPDLQFQDLSCSPDASGDVVLADTGAAVESPQADLVRYCVSLTPRQLAFGAFTQDTLDPLEDPNWLSTFSFLSWTLDTDGDPASTEYIVEFFREAGALGAVVLDAVDDQVQCASDDPESQLLVSYDDGYFVSGIPLACVGDPERVAVRVELLYDTEPADDTAGQQIDAAPDDAPFDVPVQRTPLQCPVEPVTGAPELEVQRVACGENPTDPVAQAVAVSEFRFDDFGAQTAVIARDDDYADALAGSALGFGFAPLLFTYSPGSAPPGQDPNVLAPATRQELLRVLDPNPLIAGQVVYLLGGEAAISRGVEDELRALGYRTERIAGPTRFETAADISIRVKRFVDQYVADPDFDFPKLNAVFVTTGRNWPDAVVAGSVAAYWGIPVLLTEPPTGASAGSVCDNDPPNPGYDPDNQGCRLHPATEQALRDLAPEYVYLVGGTLAVAGGPDGILQDLQPFVRDDPETSARPPFQSCGDAAVCRLGGPTRQETALLVGYLSRFLLQSYARSEVDPNNPSTVPSDARFAVAVNLAGPQESDRYANVLSATVISGYFGGAVFIPLGDDGTLGSVPGWICGREPVQDPDIERLELRDAELQGAELLLAGGPDLIPPAVADQLRQALIAPPC